MVSQTKTRNDGIGSVEQRADALTASQMAIVIVFGVIFWFMAALSVRFGSAAGLFGPINSILMYALAFPIIWAAVLLVKKVAKLGAAQIVPGIAVGGIAATLCDGIALSWGRELYGSNPDQVVFGAAWILWGVGVFLLIAYIEAHRPASASR